jgi:hypothetical protein
MISSPGILRPQLVPIYWLHRQALTRRNISHYHLAEEAAVEVGVVGVVVGEDGEGGMGKWMWTRVRKAVDPLCGLFARFNALIIGAKSANPDY